MAGRPSSVCPKLQEILQADQCLQRWGLQWRTRSLQLILFFPSFFFFLIKSLELGVCFVMWGLKRYLAYRLTHSPSKDPCPTSRQESSCWNQLHFLKTSSLSPCMELNKSVGPTAPVQALQLPCPFKAGMLKAQSKLLTAPGPSDSLRQLPVWGGGINSQSENIWNFQSTVPALRLNTSGTQTGLFLNQSLNCTKVRPAYP